MAELNLTDLCDGSGNIIVEKLVDRFYENGILLFKDPRLKGFVSALSVSPDNRINGQHHSLVAKNLRSTVPPEEFTQLINGYAIVKQVLRGDLVVQDWASFKEDLMSAYESLSDDNSGQITTYIPGLSSYDIDKWSVSFCSIDGQVLALGDYKDPFTLQSVTKPILYGITCDEVGSDTVHKYVGKEPSGFGFNKIKLGYEEIPHNPLINIGAITVSSLVRPDDPISERFESCYAKYKQLASGINPNGISFNNVVYLSEKQNGHRNYAIGHYLLNKGCINASSTGRLMEVLELYFQLCSIEVDTRSVCTMGATLANGGRNVFTGKQVLTTSTVQNTLSLMYSCGMYDYSGEWSFEFGLPAKSGVSGVIMAVLPNLGSIAMWSPPLDNYGNSVRGLGFTRNLLNRFKTYSKPDADSQSVFHPFSSKRATFTKHHSLVTSVGANRKLHTAVPPRRDMYTMARLAVPPRRDMHTMARLAVAGGRLVGSVARRVR